MVELSPAVYAEGAHLVRPAAIHADALGELATQLAAAFVDDPIIDWIASDERARGRFFSNLLKGLRPAPEWVQTTSDGQAIAVWVPSERLNGGPSIHELLSAPGFLGAVGPWRCQRLARFGLALERHHPREAAHDYLMLLGVRPEARRRGAASALISSRLRRLDESGRGAFLETANAANLPFYERHGFRRLGQFRPIGGGPGLWTMWRPPGASGPA